MAEKHEHEKHAHKHAPEVEPVVAKSPLEIDAENAAKARAKVEKDEQAVKDGKKSEYTRCWEVKQEFHGTSLYGALRVLADTKEDAIEEYCRLKCPEADAELKKQIFAREIPFIPAETEKAKPGGWKRGSKVKQRL